MACWMAWRARAYAYDIRASVPPLLRASVPPLLRSSTPPPTAPPRFRAPAPPPPLMAQSRPPVLMAQSRHPSHTDVGLYPRNSQS